MVLKRMKSKMESSEECYAQWLRKAISAGLSDNRYIGFLCGSSVEEPVELLRALVEEAFKGSVSSRYQSVFLNGGNPYVVDQLSSRYGVGKDQIICTTGATSSLSLLCRTYLAPGDHVLVESPGFDLFADFAYEQCAEVDFFNRQGEGFTIDPVEIESLIRPNTRLIMLSNLHNPSGMMVDNSVLKALAEIAEHYAVKVIFDEVYRDYADSAIWPGPASQFSPNFISVSSLTKIYGLSSVRCGWIIAQPDILSPVRAFNNQFEFGVSKLSHAVAALVMENHTVFDEYWRGELRRTRPIIERHYNDWVKEGLVFGKLPDYGCISFPGLVGVENTMDFTKWLFEYYGLIVVPGELFGASGHVRIGHAIEPDKLEHSLQCFAAGLRAYRANHAVQKGGNQ
ncbi:MAG: pyridoxal phosphate-dependent aminotransferase [Emcibacter sp.]|nr:pyridoxal phosphate-dependent aminotransferase [Emcibacter sp.]